MIRRHKTTIFTDAKESTTVYELKRIVEGILKRPPEDQQLYKVSLRPNMSFFLPLQTQCDYISSECSITTDSVVENGLLLIDKAVSQYLPGILCYINIYIKVFPLICMPSANISSHSLVLQDDQYLEDSKTLGDCGFTNHTARPQAPATVGLAFRLNGKSNFVPRVVVVVVVVFKHK